MQANTFSIYKYQRAFGYFPCKDYFKLFDSMIKPILCNGAQVWGHTYSEVVESVHFDFCKRYLKLNSKTNNMVALGECGRYPIYIDYYSYCIKYWYRLLVRPNNRYPRNCYLMQKSLDDVGRRTWSTYVKNYVFSMALAVFGLHRTLETPTILPNVSNSA